MIKRQEEVAPKVRQMIAAPLRAWLLIVGPSGLIQVLRFWNKFALP